MATLSEDSDSWKAGGIINRDARHTHNGPEAPRYRKLKRRKTCKGGKPHAFTKMVKHYRGWSDSTDGGWDVMACEICGKQKWVDCP